MKRRRSMKMAMPKPPSPRERVQSSAESLARDLTEAHPRTQAMRRMMERRLRRAMGGAMRGMNGGGGRGLGSRRT